MNSLKSNYLLRAVFKYIIPKYLTLRNSFYQSYSHLGYIILIIIIIIILIIIG